MKKAVFVLLIMLVAGSMKAAPITRTFVQGENGYNGFESLTYCDSLYEEKFSINSPWVNNGFNLKNDWSADVADLIC